MSVRIPDMPNLGAPTDDTLFVADHAGSGTLSGAALRSYMFTSSVGAITVTNLTAGTFHTTGDAQIDGTLTVNNDVTIGDALTVNGLVDMGYLHVTGSGYVEGAMQIDDTLTVNNDVTIGDALTVAGSTNIGTFHAAGDGQIDGYLNVNGNLSTYGGTGHAIGTYGPDGYLVINGKDFSSGSTGASTLIINGGGRTPYTFEFYINGVRMMAFDGAGAAFKPGGGTWADISDARIKTDVTDYAAGLAEIVQLRPVSYRFLPETGRGTKVHYGLIAQEVETVMPEMVTQASATVGDVEYTDMRSLDTQALIYALVSAVKELSTRVAALEAP